MSVAEKIVYGVATAGVVAGGYQAVSSAVERSSINDALETSIEQQAQVEAQYREENPEATQMPIDIQEGPAEYRSLLVQQSNELTSDIQLGVAFSGIWASVLVGGLMLGYRRTAYAARDVYEAGAEQVKAKRDELQELAEQVDAEHLAKVAELQSAINQAQAHKDEVRRIWDETAERNLALGTALKLAIDGHVSETGAPKEKILETADEVFEALVKYRENPGAFEDPVIAALGADTLATQPEAEQPVQPVAETEEPALKQPAPQPQTPQAPQPAPQRTETAETPTPETRAPAQPAPPRVHRARRSRPTA